MKTSIEDRYPGLDFLVTLSNDAAIDLASYGKEALNYTQSLNAIDTIFIYGIGNGHYYDLLKGWLEKEVIRELIFIEDNMQAIAALKKTGRLDAIFQNQRVHLIPVMPGADIDDLALEVVRAHPSIKIEVFATSVNQKMRRKRFDQLREALLRASVLIDSMNKESLYHHQLFKNLIVNYSRIPGSFFANQLQGAFKGVPAIICGAGPSLQESIEWLKGLSNRALICAGGSAITALTRHGIEPHLAFAVDPNPFEWVCLKENHAFETPLIFASRLLPRVFSTFNGPLGYAQTFTGGPSEHLIEEVLGLTGQEIDAPIDINGMSVTTMAIDFAIAFGCSPIILSGVDLAYTDEKRYAEGIVGKEENVSFARCMSPRADEQIFFRSSYKGEKVKTVTKWLMEADWIANKAKQNAIKIIHVAEEGLAIEGVNCLNFQEITESYLSKEFDLKGRIWCEIENARIHEDKITLVKETLDALEKSLHNVEQIYEQIRDILQTQRRLDYPALIVLEMDLKEEFAYCKLLGNLEEHVLYTVMRALPRLKKPASQQREKRYHLNCAIKKNQFMLNIVNEYLKIFKGASRGHSHLGKRN